MRGSPRIDFRFEMAQSFGHKVGCCWGMEFVGGYFLDVLGGVVVSKDDWTDEMIFVGSNGICRLVRQ